MECTELPVRLLCFLQSMQQNLIPRLHDQAGSTSWLDELLYVSWTS